MPSLPLVRSSLLLLLLSLVLSAGRAYAQVSEGGTPPSFGLKAASAIPTVRTRTIDVPSLLAEDAAEQEKGVPLRFGYPFEVDYDLDNSGEWETLADGSRLWRLRIECPGAYSINLVYRAFWMPPGGKFFLYDADGGHLLGAFTERNNKEYGQFATAPVPGDVCVLEYHEPAGVSEPGIISIQRIVHAYRDILHQQTQKDAESFGSSGACNNNVNCPEGALWQDDKRSSAMILTSGGFRLCSGALVNNVRQDLTPYFLTANHCLGGEATWVFMFNYESPSCSNIDGPTWMTVSGSVLRATYLQSDFALLELLEQPPDSYSVYYSGWSALDVAPQSSVGIHHPSGDIKKISFDDDPALSANYGAGTGGSHWRIVAWNDGTTEPGSSGSPLYDSLTHRIVGQLHGGTASCASITSDYYGKVARSWTGGGSAASRLKDWLDPDNTGAMVLDGYDPAGATFAASPRTGDVPLAVQFTGASALPVDSWQWEFGDGDTGTTQSPLHEYATAGMFDVSLRVIAGTDTVYRERVDYVIALADTLLAPDSSVPLFSTIEVTVSATNTVPLRQINIPLSFSGDLDLTLLSFSTAGCRTEDFQTQGYIHSFPLGKQATLRLISSGDGSVPDLAPGSGPIAKFVFQTSSASVGDSTVIDLSGYSSYEPLWVGPLLTYTPKISSPVLYYESCCEGTQGDADGDGLLNVGDLTFTVAFLFGGGPIPACEDEADSNGDGLVNIGDVTFTVVFLFQGGPAPGACP